MAPVAQPRTFPSRPNVRRGMSGRYSAGSPTVPVVRVLLVSTYELGHQPLHLASPAAAIGGAGHTVSVFDTAVDPFSARALEGVDAVAISVPMHTAARLAQDLVALIREARPDLPVALYGLYAGEGANEGVAARFIGEYEPGLVGWLADGAPAIGTRTSVANGTFVQPARSGLPPLDRYGRLVIDGGERLSGYIEASHGCRHRCRHCPIPAVYHGRYRIVDGATVLADVSEQVALGARHITWGDPDFLNGPRHSMALLENVHQLHPDLTHDVTIKVEHLLGHEDLLPRLAEAGVVFIVSAFETTDDRTLVLLDKGHTVDDMASVVSNVRSHGIDIHPSWMPFVPWTTPAEVVGIFEFLADHDLFGSTDPVQLSIRLLIPRGSLMLELDEVAAAIAGYDEGILSYVWRAVDTRADQLQLRFSERAEAAGRCGADPVETLLEMWADAVETAGGDGSQVRRPPQVTVGRPRLTESWFCCAEPTTLQSQQVRIGTSGGL